jgi:signal transduction histidine kinase
MITGQGDEIVAAQLIKQGALDYLPKRENYEDAVPFMIRKTIVEYRVKLESERLQKEIALRKEELEKTNAKLQELDRMKSDFVANVVHELRTPLTIIKGNLDNIEKGFAGDVQPQQKEILADVFRVINRLSRLVNDLLDLSKIESGKMELNKEMLDIAGLAKEALKGFEKLASDKGVAVIKEFPDKPVKINADKDKLTQVFVNLIGNALKFTDKGNVSLKLIELQDEVQVEIQDTGSGIPKDQIDKIFDKFVRVVAERKEGTGLGLPIAKDIITLHKGRIRVESEHGKGSRFIFVLPKS